MSAPGKKAWTEHVDLGASGQNLAVDIPRLADDRSATAGTTDASGAAPSEATSPVSDATDGQGQRTAGIAVGAVGVAVGLGAFAGLHAHSTYKDALAACGGSSSCAPGTNGLTLRQSASTWATVSTASIGAGVALAGGAVVFLRRRAVVPGPPSGSGQRPKARGFRWSGGFDGSSVESGFVDPGFGGGHRCRLRRHSWLPGLFFRRRRGELGQPRVHGAGEGPAREPRTPIRRRRTMHPTKPGR